jgi:hypothetical protein
LRLVAGRIGIISAAGAVVIRRGNRGADGGSTKAHANTDAHATPTTASVAAAAPIAADVTDTADAANATTATAIGEGIGGNAGDREDCGRGQ